jgi:hypothetical protein
MSIETRIQRLEKELQTPKQSDYLEWQNLRMAIILDEVYDGISEDETQRRLTALGTEPVLVGAVPLYVETAEALHRVYGEVHITSY